jgi:RNA exonuclease 4
MPNVFISKKAKAAMRLRRKRKQKHEPKNGESKPPVNGVVGKRKREGEDSVSVLVPSNQIKMPEGLTGKMARKFRKDARRKARMEGKDETALIFVNADGNEVQTINEQQAGGSKVILDGDVGNFDNPDASSEPKRKRRNPKSFPRINDLIAEHEENMKRQKELDSRKSVPVEEQAKYVALDCEMVGIGAGGKQSALARVSITAWDASVLMDTFVQVPDRVTDFRTHVSGVRARDIKARTSKAMELHACRGKVGSMLDGKILIGHALKNDLSALMLDHPKADIRDTAKYRPFMRPSGRGGGKMRPRKLRDLVKEHLDLDIQVEGEEHCSIDDAQATMKLYQFAKDKWDKELVKGGRIGGKR